MPNDHIQNILAEWEKNWKSIVPLFFFEGIKKSVSDALTSTYTAGFEAGLSDAEKCVPEEREIKKFFSNQGTLGEYEQIKEENRIAIIFNSCRNLTMEGIKKLRG